VGTIDPQGTGCRGSGSFTIDRTHLPLLISALLFFKFYARRAEPAYLRPVPGLDPRSQSLAEIYKVKGSKQPFYLYHATRGCHLDNYPSDLFFSSCTKIVTLEAEHKIGSKALGLSTLADPRSGLNG
jgi:hypothetical protein